MNSWQLSPNPDAVGGVVERLGLVCHTCDRLRRRLEGPSACRKELERARIHLALEHDIATHVGVGGRPLCGEPNRETYLLVEAPASPCAWTATKRPSGWLTCMAQTSVWLHRTSRQALGALQGPRHGR